VDIGVGQPCRWMPGQHGQSRMHKSSDPSASNSKHSLALRPWAGGVTGGDDFPGRLATDLLGVTCGCCLQHHEQHCCRMTAACAVPHSGRKNSLSLRAHGSVALFRDVECGYSRTQPAHAEPQSAQRLGQPGTSRPETSGEGREGREAARTRIMIMMTRIMIVSGPLAAAPPLRVIAAAPSLSLTLPSPIP
jgi:hypothetical protein